MKYIDLLEFCQLIIDTDADESVLANHHVRPNGYIERVMTRVLDAIRTEKDFDYKAYLAYIIEHVDNEEPSEEKRTIN